jgi:hypothetical protein
MARLGFKLASSNRGNGFVGPQRSQAAAPAPAPRELNLFPGSLGSPLVKPGVAGFRLIGDNALAKEALDANFFLSEICP